MEKIRNKNAMKDNQKFKETYKSVQRWMSYISNPETEDMYIRHFKAFCDKVDRDPDSLIEERRKHIIGGNYQHEDMVVGFLKEIGKEYSPYYTQSHRSAISSFYKYNRVPLNLLVNPVVYSIRQDRVPSQDEVHRMCAVSNVRDTAIILFQYQSGLRNDTISKLTYASVKDELEKGTVSCRVHVMGYQAKEGIEHDTFIGKDAIEALKLSLDERRRGLFEPSRGEKEDIVQESPLFRAHLTSAGGKKLKGKDRIMPKVSYSVSYVVSKAAKLSGVSEKVKAEHGSGTLYYPVHAHTLRKAFNTALEHAGVAENWRQYMMGHKLRGVENSYSKPSLESLREAYTRAEPNLSIYTIPKITEKTISSMEEKIGAYEERLVNQRAENERIQKQLNEITSRIEHKYEPTANGLSKLLEDKDIKALMVKKIQEDPDLLNELVSKLMKG